MRNTEKKKNSIIRFFGAVAVLCFLLFLIQGCSMAQPGETAAEGHRRHVRNRRIAQQQLMEDIDKVLLYDGPSKLSTRRIP